ncbi:hypothetical protein U9M48_032742, partial [Paspalum notatum var. saurae]
TYSQGSGQKINLQKSSLYFDSHCPPNIKQKVMDALNVRNEALQATYLGMPSYVGQSRVGVFNFIVERMWKHVQGWNDKPLSRAGKEVLLKSVAQVIPTYVMNCFKLPDGIYEKMRATISNHWWGFEGAEIWKELKKRCGFSRCDSLKPKRWDPPPEGWVMVNVDAAVFQKLNRMGLGIVIRNHKGDFLAAYRQGIDKITNPELAETLAIRRAIVFASGLPHVRVIIATDCLSVVQKLQKEVKDRSSTGIIIQDIKKTMSASNVLFSFIHVSRYCNVVAHAL